MEPATERERDRSAFGALFQGLMSDMKGSFSLWDDLVSKAAKLQTQIRATVGALALFLDAFQRVAELASSSRGGTRDIGVALTRLCLRHRSIETKLRHFSMAFVDGLVAPLQEQMDDWKRSTHSLDKDHSKEYKKARQELKKRSSDSLKLQKKTKKGSQVEGLTLEELEKNAVRRALLEQRGHYCSLVSMLRPLMDEEMRLLSEISHLQTLSDDLRLLTMDPHKLPASSEQVLLDLKSSDGSWSSQTPPTSPTSPGNSASRKSSLSSSVNSGSSDSPLFRFRSGLVQTGSVRLSSVSSQDSGFTSNEHSAPCCPAGGGAVRRSSSHHGNDLTAGEEPRAGRHHVTLAKDRDPHEELVQALTRGLNLDCHGSYRDSAYSSQSHTPSVSEDQTGSEGDNFSVGADSEMDPPTPTDPSFSSRRPLPLRPAPSAQTPGVATIRRAPSSKASLRSSALFLNLGPAPVRPPMIPVKTPTVPRPLDMPRPPDTPSTPPPGGGASRDQGGA